MKFPNIENLPKELLTDKKESGTYELFLWLVEIYIMATEQSLLYARSFML